MDDYKYDYSGTHLLYQLEITPCGQQYLLWHDQNNPKLPVQRIAVTSETLFTEYVSIADFFNTCTYVGKEAYTKTAVPISKHYGDYSFFAGNE